MVNTTDFAIDPQRFYELVERVDLIDGRLDELGRRAFFAEDKAPEAPAPRIEAQSTAAARWESFTIDRIPAGFRIKGSCANRVSVFYVDGVPQLLELLGRIG